MLYDSLLSNNFSGALISLYKSEPSANKLINTSMENKSCRIIDLLIF